ncbi:hypothetical protein TL16_g08424 [Triparma laevis f. inornata]|uniref:Leucine rich repeats-containing protein n=2 Tax=Triparma laevis TaxID=1534972 RepID=A0A9W7KUG9_9STRA|nr:hypothetical protein TL16_g08424 [Triparma laevis f. inornata]GMI11959.1 hypothetical protein TrLO_g5756 [Triparma laevis f. longispina]
MHTHEFKRHFVDFVPLDALMALRVATKGWNAAADALMDEGVESSTIMVHDGKDISMLEALPQYERRKLFTRVIFLLNITKVGDYAYAAAPSLVVVVIPEGVESIGVRAFKGCHSLTSVSFPRTLKLICQLAALYCTSLENVDLLHTNLQELGQQAFSQCYELKSTTIPDSLQTLGDHVFLNCFKLVPSNIWPGNEDAVVAHLRSKQQQREAERIIQEKKQQQREVERIIKEKKQQQNDARVKMLQQR